MQESIVAHIGRVHRTRCIGLLAETWNGWMGRNNEACAHVPDLPRTERGADVVCVVVGHRAGVRAGEMAMKPLAPFWDALTDPLLDPWRPGGAIDRIWVERGPDRRAETRGTERRAEDREKEQEEKA